MAIEIRLWEKVSGYFSELLLDERRTLEDLNKNSLSFRIDLSVNNPDERHSREKEVRNRWNKKIDAKLKMKNRNYGFEMVLIIAIASIIVLPLTIFQVVEYFTSVTNSQQIAQNLDFYTKTADFWNTNLIMKYSLLSTLIWNDERYIKSNHTKSSAVFKASLKKMTDDLIPDMIQRKNNNLGSDFVATYSHLLSGSSACEISANQNHPIRGCGANHLSFMGKTTIDYLKWVNTLVKDAYYIWEIQRDNPNCLNEIFSAKEFSAFVNNSLDGGIERQLYYSIMIPLGNNLKVVTDPAIKVGSSNGAFVINGDQTRPASYYLFFVIPLSIVTLLLLLRYVYWRLVWTYTAFWRTALLLPVEIILKNPLLMNYLRGIEASTKSRISFF